MKIVLLADIHVGVPQRLDDIMWSLRMTRQYCLENDIDIIIILGDLFHNRESTNNKDSNVLVQFLEETVAMGIRFISFPGNHDMYLKNSWEINALKSYEKYIESYHEVTNITLGSTRFWIVPFIHYESEYMDTINNLDHKEGDVLLTHIGVNNAILNTCFLIQNWSFVNFSDSKFDRIYTGHFHTHQQVGDNCWYIGSPIPFKFEEGDSDHGFMVFDTETRDHEFVSIWSIDSTYKAPQFMTVSIEDALESKELDGNVVRVRLDKEYTTNELYEIRGKLLDKGALQIKWMTPKVKESDEIDKEIEDTDKLTPDQLFEKFAEQDDNTKDLDVDLLFSLNTQVISDGDKIYNDRNQIG